MDDLVKITVQTGHLDAGVKLTSEKFSELFTKRIEFVDFEKAKNDVVPFIKDTDSLNVWSRDFFLEVQKRIVLEIM